MSTRSLRRQSRGEDPSRFGCPGGHIPDPDCALRAGCRKETTISRKGDYTKKTLKLEILRTQQNSTPSPSTKIPDEQRGRAGIGDVRTQRGVATIRAERDEPELDPTQFDRLEQ